MKTFYNIKKQKQISVLRLCLALVAILVVPSLSAQIGLYMRDFEGAKCFSLLNGCTNNDTGLVPSCALANCGSGTCHLWKSNDVWIDTDTDADNLPDSGTSYSSTSFTCPELPLSAVRNTNVFVAIRVMINNDFFTNASFANGAYEYQLKAYYVQASLGIQLNNFTQIATTIPITFTKTGGTITSLLLGPGAPANADIEPLSDGISEGFVVFIPWHTPNTASHFCLLAEIGNVSGTAADKLPLRTTGDCVTSDPTTTHSGYSQFIQCNDNAVWRNIEIVDPVTPAAPGGDGIIRIVVMAPNNPEINTTIQIDLKSNRQIGIKDLWNATLDWSALPSNLKDAKRLLEYNESLRGAKWDGNFAKIPITSAKFELAGLKLPAGKKLPLNIKFKSNRLNKTDTTTYQSIVDILQFEAESGKKPELVGGYTVLLVSKKDKIKRDDKDDCQTILCKLKMFPWWGWAIAAGILILLLLFRKKK